MKILRIEQIKNLGTFSDFQWNESCDDFKKYNFFYGWNYSGKTTLSRIFKCLEDKSIHPNFPLLQFKLNIDDGNKITEKDIGNDFDIRVFNEEFIEENFKWNDENHEISPVLILGKESIELKEEREKLEKEKLEKEKRKNDLKRERDSKRTNFNDLLTEKATNIRGIIGITNQKEFDRPKLEKEINNIKENYKENILNEKEYQSLLDTLKSRTDFKIISKVEIKLELNNYINEVRNIMSKRIISQQIIEKFKDNPKLNSWVREGIELHKNETTCQFCGNTLPSDLIERLSKHFSDEFDSIIKEIEDEKVKIENHNKSMEKINFTDMARLFPDFQENYEEIRIQLKNELDNYCRLLKDLKGKLDLKKEKPFEKLDFEEIKSNQEQIENIVEQINDIIKGNNEKVQNLENGKNNAKDKIIKHLTAKVIENNDYFNEKQTIDNYEEQINRLNDSISNIEKQIEQINQQIESKSIGAKRINEYLEKFFNDNKLKLNLLENGKYQIFRDEEIAKNLSTGERNIISLIYFFTRLEEVNFNLNQSIIFIDDPVSSLDSNHIFKVYGFLNEKLNIFDQLFITTHNFDFFNLLKDFSRGKSRSNESAFFLIKKVSNSSGTKRSIIEDLPKMLKDFKSEYNYLFSILKNFNEKEDKANFEFLYLMPNIARRFLELYLYMKYPNGQEFKVKCKKFLENRDMEKITILKILNEYSHEENIEHATRFPDIYEVENCVNYILSIIEEKDEEHYKALCEYLEIKNS
ncbi:MAG TPA: AAA family ATPase [Candidatus Hydrogenedens sp.]|nr:AAA family ATPase [Candidatus Hydrogenedens sp.]